MDLNGIISSAKKSWPELAEAWDPPFDEASFHRCQSVEELKERFEHGNWAMGTGFIYESLCFVNLVDGGSEWLTFKDGKSFECYSMDVVLRKGDQYFYDEIKKLMA